MKKDLGSYRPDRLTSIPEKIIQQIYLNTISEHTKEIKLTTASVHKRTEVDAITLTLVYIYIFLP